MRKSRKSNFDRNRNSKELRINEKIKAKQVRVIPDDGGSPEVLSCDIALKRAQNANLDLVEISPNQSPPVCRIINYGKYKFEQKKRKREQAKHQHQVSIKEIKLRPKIATHDYELKKRNAGIFLSQGHKVKVTVRFRGREITHSELGMNLVNRFVTDMKDNSNLEYPPRQEGKQIHLVLSPNGQGQANANSKKKEINKKEKKFVKKEIKTEAKKVEKKEVVAKLPSAKSSNE